MLLAINGVALADDAATVGREGQAFGNSLADKFQFPTEGADGTLNLGNGESIAPGDMATKGDGFYVVDPNVGGLQGIFDSDETMHDVGRGAQNQLWQDAQLKGNPFDPDPALRDQPGPSTVSGAVYQIITGVSDARAQVPDLTNDPIVHGAGDHILNPDLLESFGDCSVETEVKETTRPVHVPDLEYCERITAPAPTNCQIKHEIIVERITDSYQVNGTGSRSQSAGKCGSQLPRKFDVVINSDACMNMGNKTLEGLSVSVISGYSQNWSDSDNGVICGGATTGSLPLDVFPSKPKCNNGKMIVSIENKAGTSGWRPDYWVHSVTVNVKGTVLTEQLRIGKDNWYPEECVKAAQKSSG